MKSVIREILSYVIIIVIVLFIKYYIASPINVVGKSMVPTLHDRDLMLLDEISYRFSDIKRFDIVVARTKDGFIIKRVIGLPGETVSQKDGYIYIDDEKLEEPWLPDDVVGKTFNSTGGLDFDYGKVPENCYFLLGDNREYSYDCRFFSNRFINSKAIKAKAVFRYYPFDRISFGID